MSKEFETIPVPNKRIKDLNGQKFDKWTVLGLSPITKSGNRCWVVKCDCGTMAVVRAGDLNKGSSTSCGCNRIHDLTGQVFGRLTVIDLSTRKSGTTRMWNVVCECGNKRTIASDSLVKGNTKSCGCLAHDPAMDVPNASNTRIYNIWKGMRERCSVSKHSAYKNYGERGIRVSDEWSNSFKAFRDWAYSNGYTDDLTIDRIDNDGDYEPDNCRWFTYTQQSNNRSDNILVEHQGKKQTLSQWSIDLNIKYGTLSGRYYRGDRGSYLLRPIEKQESNNVLVEYQNKKQTLTEWSRELNIHYSTLLGRYRRGDRSDRLFRPVRS